MIMMVNTPANTTRVDTDVTISLLPASNDIHTCYCRPLLTRRPRSLTCVCELGEVWGGLVVEAERVGEGAVQDVLHTAVAPLGGGCAGRDGCHDALARGVIAGTQPYIEHATVTSPWRWQTLGVTHCRRYCRATCPECAPFRGWPSLPLHAGCSEHLARWLRNTCRGISSICRPGPPRCP